MAIRTFFPSSSNRGGAQAQNAQLPQYRLSISQLNVPIQHYLSSIYPNLPTLIASLAQAKLNVNVVSFRIDTTLGGFVAQGTRHHLLSGILPFNVCGDPQVVLAIKKASIGI